MDPPSSPPPASPDAVVVEYTVYLRVIGIFAILVASLVGSIPPLLVDLRTGRRWQVSNPSKHMNVMIKDMNTNACANV